MNAITMPAATVGVRSIDATRGSTNGAVSAQWWSRPDDQKFLSLNELYDATAHRRDVSFEERIDARSFKFHATKSDNQYIGIETPGGRLLTPSHYSFGQLCSLGGAPAGYLRKQQAFRSAFNLTMDLQGRFEADLPVKVYGDSETAMLRAATGPDYGRIHDSTLVDAFRKFAGNGTGDTRWKVPGLIDWSTMKYNPYVDITKETTTLFASDRDVFIFLVDDLHPIEVGKLKNGEPDYLFRGVYAWNSEVGSRSIGLATFLMRGCCMNRMIWGMEDFQELKINHTKNSQYRFVREAEPALERYATSSPTKMLAGINAAKEALVKDVEEQKKLLNKTLGFSMKQTVSILEAVEREEGHPVESVWDLCNGITAVARGIPHTDDRLEVEKTAARLMNRAARNAF